MSRYPFSKKSQERIDTCHEDIQTVLHFVQEIINLRITQGHRSRDEQIKLFKAMLTKVKKSKHNEYPSKAFDAAPYPIRWPEKTDRNYVKDIARFYYMGGIVMAVAHMLGIEMRWGGDWDRDLDFSDQDFDDLVHFELV